MSLTSLTSDFVLLLGVASLVAAVVNSLKVLGFVKDGDAGTWSLALNLGLFVAFVALKVFAPVVDIAQLDAVAGTIATVLTLVVGLVVQFGLTRGAHVLLLKGAPVVGKSFSQSAPR